MFVYAGAKSAQLLERQISIEFQLSQLAEAQSRITSSLDKVYGSAQSLEPGDPSVVAGHDQLVSKLFEWQKRVTLTMTRLRQEYDQVKAYQTTVDKQFKDGVKQYFEMIV
jgi:uncharacterized protein involved in exopolysaccharide biosynthesis